MSVYYEELSSRAAAANQPQAKYSNWENIKSGKVSESLPCLALPLNKQIQSESLQSNLQEPFNIFPRMPTNIFLKTNRTKDGENTIYNNVSMTQL